MGLNEIIHWPLTNSGSLLTRVHSFTMNEFMWTPTQKLQSRTQPKNLVKQLALAH